MRAPQICPRPGCPNVMPCPAHPRQRWAAGARGRTMPADWEATRLRILARDPACRDRGPGCTGRSTEVDHITAGAGEAEWNLRGLCATCHRAHTQAQAREARR